MDPPIWNAVDGYLADHVLSHDTSLDDALAASAAAGLPEIHVAPNQGKLLMMLAQLVRARRILEIGTLGGFSAIWLARSLPPGGRLITLEAMAHHADVARKNLARAGVDDRVEVRVGPALETLAAMRETGEPAFDLVFIDADKAAVPEYVTHSIALTEPGALILVDNVVRRGAILDAADADPSVRGIRRFFDMIAVTPGIDATALQTVGAKGHDGFALLRRTVEQ